VVQWLILQGAANNDHGHIDQVDLQKGLPSLAASLRLLLKNHDTFTFVVLASTHVLVADRAASNAAAPKTYHPRSSQCALVTLLGHGQHMMMELIADFAVVPRGRGLRNARKALWALDCIEWLQEMGFDPEVDRCEAIDITQ